MQIKDITTDVLGGKYILVRVHTDEGITGVSECSPMNVGVINSVIHDSLKPLLIGCDPRAIESAWQMMYFQTYKIAGRSQSIGISAVEVALWDILGKALKAPVYQLLGGAVRTKVRVYASFMGDTRQWSPIQVARRAAECVDQGFTAVKIKIGTRYGFDQTPDESVRLVREVRQAVGDDIELLVDANSAYSPHRAIQVGRKLEEYGVFHFEEPVPVEDLDGLAQVSAALDMPVAGGEQDHTKYRFREILEKRAVDIIQPDVLKAGGLSESKKIAAMADAFGIVCTPHNTQPSLGTAATLHFVASTPNCRYAQEYRIGPHPLREGLLREPLLAQGGFLQVPQGPGLGVELDERAVEKLRG